MTPTQLYKIFHQACTLAYNRGKKDADIKWEGADRNAIYIAEDIKADKDEFLRINILMAEGLSKGDRIILKDANFFK